MAAFLEAAGHGRMSAPSPRKLLPIRVKDFVYCRWGEKPIDLLKIDIEGGGACSC